MIEQHELSTLNNTIMVQSKIIERWQGLIEESLKGLDKCYSTNKIKKLWRTYKITGAEIHRRSGISMSNIGNIRNHDSDPRFSTIKLLTIVTDEIIKEKESQRPKINN